MNTQASLIKDILLQASVIKGQKPRTEQACAGMRVLPKGALQHACTYTSQAEHKRSSQYHLLVDGSRFPQNIIQQ